MENLFYQSIIYIYIYVLVKEEDAGKYMVRATNAGGEAQSIADIAVFKPKPDTMVEVHKTVIYENVQDENVVQVIYLFYKQNYNIFIIIVI